MTAFESRAVVLSESEGSRRESPMPLVQITMLEGRSTEQKRKLATRITDAMVEEAGARREAVVVAFHEVSKESYASGGVLMADKTK
ncbi:MAG TPA: 2-hydroxymuconate tautomerase [Terriglobales bacterium]|nr:2-hydroxymuconate tautomerase [Terriglobales bacterium]